MNDRNNERYTEMVKMFLNAGSDPNIKNERDESLLYISCLLDNIPLIKLLLSAGANVEEGAGGDNVYQTPLALACEDVDLKIMKILLDAGADPNNYKEESLISWVIGSDEPISKKILGLRLLLDAGTDLNKINDYGNIDWSFNQVVQDDDNVDIVKLLLENGLNPNNEKYFRNSLYIASENGALENIKVLINAGADIDLESPYYNLGKTALIIASQNNNLDIVELLLDAGANPNKQDIEGNTPLFISLEEDVSENIIQILLEAGADPYIKNNNGANSILIAKRYTYRKKYLEIMEPYIDKFETQKAKQRSTFAQTMTYPAIPSENMRYEPHIMDTINQHLGRIPHDPDVNRRIKVEDEENKTQKAKQRSTFAQTMTYPAIPSENMGYEPHIMDTINQHLGRIQQDPDVYRRIRVEGEENKRMADYIDDLKQYGGKRKKKTKRKRIRQTYFF